MLEMVHHWADQHLGTKQEMHIQQQRDKCVDNEQTNGMEGSNMVDVLYENIEKNGCEKDSIEKAA